MKSEFSTLDLISLALITLGSSSVASAACTRVDADYNINPGVQVTHVAMCGASETAVGGGFSLGSNNLIIHATLPTSSVDGWTAEVENVGSSIHGLKVSAVCCSVPVCSRVDADFNINAGETLIREVTCGSGDKAVGGGFSLGSNNLVIHASLPTSSVNGWSAEVENVGSATHGFKVSCVCCSQLPVELQLFSIE